MYQTLLTSVENQILTVTINRPDKLNAINAQVMDDLAAVVKEINDQSDIRSAIITGAGEKSFVAGADISEFSGVEDEGYLLSRKGQEVFNSIERSAKPIIAAINGFALGAGCELAMACHFRIAASHARFGQPEVNLGLIPGYGATQRLTRLIGRGRAMEMLLSAQMIDAPTALAYGLVNKLTDPDRLLEETLALLQIINTKAPLAVAGCIRAVDAAFGDPEKGYDTEAQLFASCFATEDLKEGRAAFLEKRKANFKGQ